jgi:SAM-dependent methyltransferase
MDSYGARVEAQIKQYEFVENMHELPDSFHHFSHNNIRPRVVEVFDTDSFAEFFARGMTQEQDRARSLRLLSIGSGDATYELDVAQRILADGYTDFVIECAEISPLMNSRAEQRVAAAGMAQHFKLLEVDINTWTSEGRYDGAMAHHSLHHIVELEHVFLNVKRSLQPGANFCVADMIGRNGHMRWPEVLEYVDLIWRFLPLEKKRNHQLKRVEEVFDNFDCSHEGFEGIRAQDILPLMLGTFSFRAFASWGGLVDVLFDRAFGWNFDPKDDADRAFIDFIARLNDDLVEAGRIKPTQMLATLTADAIDTPARTYRGLTPQAAVRWPTRPVTER